MTLVLQGYDETRRLDKAQRHAEPRHIDCIPIATSYLHAKVRPETTFTQAPDARGSNSSGRRCCEITDVSIYFELRRSYSLGKGSLVRGYPPKNAATPRAWFHSSVPIAEAVRLGAADKNGICRHIARAHFGTSAKSWRRGGQQTGREATV